VILTFERGAGAGASGGSIWGKMKLGALALAVLVGVTGPGQGAELLFASGFEGEVRLAPQVDDLVPIVGRDSETGFAWPIDVLGARGSGLHLIAVDGGRAAGAALQRLRGHDGTMTRALYSYENYEARDDTQLPYEILDIRQGRRDLYVRFWIRLDRESLHQKDKWRTFFEWKTRGNGRGRGFRLISFIYTDGQGRPYWHFQGDRDPEHPIWEIDNFDIPVPEGKWFLNEFFWHWSEGRDGRALWRVNGRTVGDHRGPTTRNGQALDFIMLGQIYGDANPKHQWVDDIEIWDGWPPG